MGHTGRDAVFEVLGSHKCLERPTMLEPFILPDTGATLFIQDPGPFCEVTCSHESSSVSGRENWDAATAGA